MILMENTHSSLPGSKMSELMYVLFLEQLKVIPAPPESVVFSEQIKV